MPTPCMCASSCKPAPVRRYFVMPQLPASLQDAILEVWLQVRAVCSQTMQGLRVSREATSCSPACGDMCSRQLPAQQGQGSALCQQPG